jgi:glycosyltransferase involved in cell wall biosynthesis
MVGWNKSTIGISLIRTARCHSWRTHEGNCVISVESAATLTGARASKELERIEALLAAAAHPDAHPSRVVVVMPAYNAARTLQKTVADLPQDAFDEIILVDDCSQDETVAVARGLGLSVIERQKNGGYGANQKTCYKHALDRGADYVVMVHPDYQYDSRVVGAAVEFLRLGICDIVLGSRIRSRKEALQNGMPLYKYWANRFLTSIENLALGQNSGDLHSGFRAYRRQVLETIPFERNSDDFVFDSQFLAQAAYFGFRIGDVPMPVRYFPEASSINFRRSLKYGLSTLAVIAEFWGHKLGIRRSVRFAECSSLKQT